MVLSQPVLDAIRRELRRVSPDVKIDSTEIGNVLSSEVFKREVLEGDKAEEARRKIARSQNRQLRAKAAEEPESQPVDETKA